MFHCSVHLIPPRLEHLSTPEPEHTKNAGLSYRNITGEVNPLLQRRTAPFVI
jgi:hypothetical protein